MPPKIGIVEAYKFENYKNAVEKHGGEVVQLNVKQNSDEYISRTLYHV